MRRKWILVIASAVCLLVAAGVLAWALRPEPPPPTADDVLAAVAESDPTQLSDEEVETWMARVASTLERLPPHEMQALVQKALGDEALRKRFEALTPEQRQKMAGLISEQQRARMMATMATGMVATFKVMPAPLRKMAFEKMRAGREEHRGKHPKMTKERFAQFHAATTPTQRAEFVRAMREMRKMMQEAGINQ